VWDVLEQSYARCAKRKQEKVGLMSCFPRLIKLILGALIMTITFIHSTCAYTVFLQQALWLFQMRNKVRILEDFTTCTYTTTHASHVMQAHIKFDSHSSSQRFSSEVKSDFAPTYTSLFERVISADVDCCSPIKHPADAPITANPYSSTTAATWRRPKPCQLLANPAWKKDSRGDFDETHNHHTT